MTPGMRGGLHRHRVQSFVGQWQSTKSTSNAAPCPKKKTMRQLPEIVTLQAPLRLVTLGVGSLRLKVLNI